MKKLVEFIIPTYNNPDLLSSCLKSILQTVYPPIQDLIHITVVNNGHPGLRDTIKLDKYITVLEPGRNLGWEGGLKLGLENSDSHFVVLCNDDIRMITGSNDWFWKMVPLFNDPMVGAVGPSSNFVMGPQTIFADIPSTILDVKYLIGFWMLVKREALVNCGGVDESLPGGDDIDLSIRLRDSGYKLLIRRDVFVFHHGQATGTRVHPGYWNSQKMQNATNQALIRKHGMLKFWETMVMGPHKTEIYDDRPSKDLEGDFCRKYVIGEKILEVGCGGVKTDPRAVGVDKNCRGENIPNVTLGQDICVADVVDDVSRHLPVEDSSQDTIIARHILEHCQDTLGTLAVWNKALRLGGRLIVAVPNSSLRNTIAMNPEHVVSFTPESLETLARVCGFVQEVGDRNLNQVSMVSVFKKIGSPVLDIPIPIETFHPLAARMENSETIKTRIEVEMETASV